MGSSVCGVSAIIATQGAIEANDEDTSYAIGAILALGAVGLFAFPAIGHALHMSDHGQLVWSKFPKFVLGFLLVSALASSRF